MEGDPGQYPVESDYYRIFVLTGPGWLGRVVGPLPGIWRVTSGMQPGYYGAPGIAKGDAVNVPPPYNIQAWSHSTWQYLR
jgi:hypothetical protein